MGFLSSLSRSLWVGYNHVLALGEWWWTISLKPCNVTLWAFGSTRWRRSDLRRARRVTGGGGDEEKEEGIKKDKHLMSLSLVFAKEKREGEERGKFWEKVEDFDSGEFASRSRSKDRGWEAIHFETRIWSFIPWREVSRVWRRPTFFLEGCLAVVERCGVDGDVEYLRFMFRLRS